MQGKLPVAAVTRLALPLTKHHKVPGQTGHLHALSPRRSYLEVGAHILAHEGGHGVYILLERPHLPARKESSTGASINSV